MKAYAKANHFDSNYDTYKAAYGSMPTHVSANDQIKQLYIEGHFCYAYKIGIVTNDLGIVRHLEFYNKKFLQSHPELVPNKKSNSPDEDKSIHDARFLIPTLQDLYKAHPLINPKTFLGDAAFDPVGLYKSLLTGDTLGLNKHFSTACIPLNSRSHLENVDYKTNENGVPCCPKDESLPMKYECICNNPCTDSRCGGMIYIYLEKMFVLIWVHFVVPLNGIPHIKSAPPLSVP